MLSDVEMVDDVAPPSLSPAPLPSPSLSAASLPNPPPSASVNSNHTTNAAASSSSTSASTFSKPLSTKPKSSKPASAAPASAHRQPRSRSPSPPPPPPPPPPLQTIRLTIPLGGPSNYEVDIALKAKETGQRPPTPVNTVSVTAGAGDKRRAVDTSDSEPDKPAGENPAEPGKKKRKKKSTAQEYYDVHDPFIDDSELAIDERTFFAQTKQKGFYVSQGEVALLRDKSPIKKPKSAAAALAGSSNANGSGGGGGGGSTMTPKPKSTKLSKGLGFLTHPTAKSGLGSLLNAIEDGTRDAPISVRDADDENAAPHPNNRARDDGSTSSRQRSLSSSGRPGAEDGSVLTSTSNHVVKREPRDDDEFDMVTDSEDRQPMFNGVQKKERTYTTIMENGKKKKIVVLESFHQEIQTRVKALKVLINAASWEKGKFPQDLREPLAELACEAIKLDEYDEHFFFLMPQIFPYNKFTMSKLIKRMIFPQHIALLQTAQDNLLKKLEKETKDGLSKAQEEYDKSVAAWDRRQERLKADAAASSTPANGTTTGSDDGGVDEVEKSLVVSAQHNTTSSSASTRPTQKYRMTESIRAIIWQLVRLSNECCRLENEKNKLEQVQHQVSEQGSRKQLYQKIVAAFPEGWMNSSQISREVSAMKKKVEKEAMENED